MIYLYGIAEADVQLPECVGLEDKPVGLISAGALAGVCSQHERSAFDPEPAALWRHDQVVEAVMSSGAVLPARFGTTFAEADAVGAALKHDMERLRTALEAVRGCVELAVRVRLPASSTPTARSGQEYVRGELDRRRERRAAADRMLVPLEAHAVRSRTGRAEQGDLTASYLVRAEAVDGFTERVRVLARDHSELTLSCTGPWPPYSFVGEEDG